VRGMLRDPAAAKWMIDNPASPTSVCPVELGLDQSDAKSCMFEHIIRYVPKTRSCTRKGRPRGGLFCL